MSQVHHDPDVAAELFMLEPSGEDVAAGPAADPAGVELSE
jgi:hypothetical protein